MSVRKGQHSALSSHWENWLPTPLQGFVVSLIHPAPGLCGKPDAFVSLGRGEVPGLHGKPDAFVRLGRGEDFSSMVTEDECLCYGL